MKKIPFCLLILVALMPLVHPASSWAGGRGTRNVEVLYPFFYGDVGRYGPQRPGALPYGPDDWPCYLRFKAGVDVGVKEIKDGVEIRLTSYDEKTVQGLRIMGRMLRLIHDVKEFEGGDGQ